MNERITKRETRSRPPGFSEAWLFSVWGGLAAMAGAAGLIMLLESGHWLWLALSVGSLAFWRMLIDRKEVHDERAFTVSEEIMETPARPTPQGELYRPWVVHPTPGGRHIQMGSISLTLKQWQVLARLLLQNGKLTRRVVAESDVFDNVTSKYPEIQREFTRLGWFDGNGMITDAGRQYFHSLLTPPTPPQPNGAVAHQGPTTTDDDHRPRGVHYG